MATGIAPSPFRIVRALLERLENANTGDIVLEDLYAPVPADRVAQARAATAVLGDSVAGKMPWAPGVRAISNDALELFLNSTWKPTLTITGAEGLPALIDAGNVLLPRLAVKLSLRLPPTVDAARATERIRAVLEADPPYGARVAFTGSGQGGWNAPALAPWLESALTTASQSWFGRPALAMGTGGTIPFISMLAERYPGTQFLVTGVLGPNSNAHGPNEFLHLPTARRVTGCVADVLAAHAQFRQSR
jgi:acetylornithine deacetylase/succinyl-diaminopimelate desuccinylase-like protein